MTCPCFDSIKSKSHNLNSYKLENNLIVNSLTCTFMESLVILSEDCKCFAPINAMLSPVPPVSNEWKHPALLGNQLWKRLFALLRQSAGKEINNLKKKIKKKIPLLPAQGAWRWVRERDEQQCLPWASAVWFSNLCSLFAEPFLCSGVRSHLFLMLIQETPFTQGIWWRHYLHWCTHLCLHI